MENPSPNTIRFPWPQPVAIPTHSHTISINQGKTYEIAERTDNAYIIFCFLQKFQKFLSVHCVLSRGDTQNHKQATRSNLLSTSYMTNARNVHFCSTPTAVASRRAWSMTCVVTECKRCAWLSCHLWTPLCTPTLHTTVTHTGTPRMIWNFVYPHPYPRIEPKFFYNEIISMQTRSIKIRY